MKTHRINIRPGPRWRDGTEGVPVGRDAVSTTGHRELDIGHRPRGAPKQSKRHPERSDPACPEIFGARRTCTTRAGGGSARLDQILRVWETTLRMTEGFGNGGPPRLAETFVGRPACPEIFGARRTCTTRVGGDAFSTTRHREVDVGRTFSSTTGIGPPTHRNLFTRTTIRSGGPKVWEDSKRTFGRYEGYERARESIARLVDGTRITSNLSKVRLNATGTFEKYRATRSCASDAEHEFSRTRCPGRYPMLSFRDPEVRNSFSCNRRCFA